MTLNAETTWFHVFKSMVTSGEIARMGVSAYAVYCTIKAHANISTGKSFPSIELIAEKTGLSTRQVMRELETLCRLEHVSKSKQGRSNTYSFREKINIFDDMGNVTAIADWDYVPAGVKAAVKEVTGIVATGDFGSAKTVNIQHLTVNVHTGSGDIINVALETMRNEMGEGELKNKITQLLTKALKS